MKDGWYERLIEAIEGDGRSYLAISQAARPALGPNYVEQMIKRGTKPKLTTLNQLLAAFTPQKQDWVLYGDEAGSHELQYIRDEDEDPESSEEYAQGYTRDHWEPKFPGALPELDISAGAGEGKIGNVIVLPLDGGGVSAHEVVDEWPLPMTWLHEAVNDVRQSLVVKVVGESMTPNYLPGDRVIVDLSQDRFVSDSVYLISDGESAPQIKRLQRVPLTVPTRVTIISDNPAYQNHEVEVDLLRIHGRVCAHVGRT